MKPSCVQARGLVFSGREMGPEFVVACYPSLLRLTDGSIACSFRVGSDKSGADESVRIAHSVDNGASWNLLPFAPETRLDGVAGSLSTGHMIEPAPGHLRLQGNWVDRSEPDLPISDPETGGCLPLKVVAFESFDGGQSWGAIQEVVGFPFEQPEVSGPLIALAEPGHLLQPMENQKHYRDPAPIDEKAYALISRDWGKSWPEWALIAYDHPARKFWCNRVARFPSGDLVAVSWTFDNESECDLPLHLTLGSPDGLTWGEPFSTTVNGQVSYLLPLSDERLLMATSHRESPASIRLRTSADRGVTWDGDGLLVFDAESQAAHAGGDLAAYYQQMTNYSFGWSPMIKLDDGSILLAYFAGTSQAIDIHWARISL